MSRQEKYKCEICGKNAILGNHFCNIKDVKKYQQKKDSDPDADLRPDYFGDEVQKLKISEHIYAASTVIGLILVNRLLFLEVGIYARIFSVVIGILILIFIYRQKINDLFKPSFKYLVSICFGDKGTAERLVAQELKRNSKISRKEAIDRAIQKLIYDRSR